MLFEKTGLVTLVLILSQATATLAADTQNNFSDANNKSEPSKLTCELCDSGIQVKTNAGAPAPSLKDEAVSLSIDEPGISNQEVFSMLNHREGDFAFLMNLLKEEKESSNGLTLLYDPESYTSPRDLVGIAFTAVANHMIKRLTQSDERVRNKTLAAAKIGH